MGDEGVEQFYDKWEGIFRAEITPQEAFAFADAYAASLRAEVARLQEELEAHKGTCGDLWEQVARLEKERDGVLDLLRDLYKFTIAFSGHRIDKLNKRAEARIRELEDKKSESHNV
jgi:hypothetical protein